MPNRIREKRQAAGLTLQDVADKLGTTAVTVSRWEREPQRVTLPILDKLAGAIGCNKEELLSPSQSVTNAKPLDDAAKSTVSEFYNVPAENLAVVEIITDTMEPTLLKGDRCVIDRSITWVDNAGVFVFIMNGEACLMRCYRRLSGKIRMTLDNPLYQASSECTDEDVKIIGKVVGFSRKL